MRNGPAARQLAPAQFVQNLARFRIPVRIIGLRLQAGKMNKGPASRLRSQNEHLQTRQERIPAERGHVLRYPGSDHLAVLARSHEGSQIADSRSQKALKSSGTTIHPRARVQPLS